MKLIKMVIWITIWLISLSEAAKLPGNVIPSKYTITLQTDIDKGQLSFSGKVKIDVNVLVQTQKILLNMHGLIVSNVDVFNSKSHFVDSNFFLEPPVKEIITIELDSVLSVGSYTVEMNFKGNFRNGSSGFLSSTVRSDEGLEEYAAVTNCHSGQNCRYIFPCFDETQFLAKFNVEIKHNKNYAVISNTEIKKRTETMTAYAITSFEETQAISINVFGFAVLNFRQVGPNNVRIKHQVFAERKALTSGQASTALNQGDMVIETFHNLLGLSAIIKLDQIILPNYTATPDGYHPCGIMLANLTHLIKNLDNYDDELEITKSIAVKYSMQYFGCSMLAKDSSLLRLLKGLETLLGYLVSDEILPSKRVMELFMVETMSAAFMTEKQLLEENIEHWSTIKAASVLKMFQNAFTNSVFLIGLRYFIADNKNSAVTLVDFHDSLQKAFDENSGSTRLDITSIMTSWEEISGYPILKVQRSSKVLITLTQKHSVQSSTSIFEIPVNFATKNTHDFTETSPDFWMNERSMVIDVETSAKKWDEKSWVIFNVQRTGFYRVDYDSVSWKLIIDAMLTNHNEIILSNRGQILDDLLYFIKESTTPSTLFLDLISYLSNETDFYPWHEAQKGFEFFHTMLFGSSVFEDLLKLYREIMANPYDKNEYFNDKTKKIIESVACKMELEKCIQDASDKLPILSSTTLNEKNLFDLCYALRFTEISNLEKFLDLISTDDKAQRSILIKGLSCSENGEFLDRFFSTVVNSLEADEVYDLFSYFIQQNPLGVNKALSVLLENENLRLQDRMNEIIVLLARRINSENLATRLDMLIARDISFLSPEVIRKCQATVEGNLEWVELNLFDISHYFLPKDSTTDVPSTSSDFERPGQSPMTTETTNDPETTNEPEITTVPDRGSQSSLTAFTFYFLALINTIIKF